MVTKKNVHAVDALITPLLAASLTASSQRFAAVLEELTRRFDRIILDSPPLQVVTDAVVLSKKADGVIMVVHAGKTLRDDLKRSERMVRAVDGKIFGVIVNAIEPDQRSGYYYSYYGYAEKPAAESQQSRA